MGPVAQFAAILVDPPARRCAAVREVQVLQKFGSKPDSMAKVP